MPKAHKSLVPATAEVIGRRIFQVRGSRVMIDTDLATLYGVSTGHMNLAVRRNRNRFPDDFMFRLTSREYEGLISQIAISNGRGGRRSLPWAFNEQGVAMLSSVLHSHRAAMVNVVIMRAFVHMRKTIAVTHREMWRHLQVLEEKYDKHDSELKAVFKTLHNLLQPQPKGRYGFVAGAPASTPNKR